MLPIALVLNMRMYKDAQASSIIIYIMGCSLYTLDEGNNNKKSMHSWSEWVRVSVFIAEVCVGAAGPPSCVRSFAAAKAQLPGANSGKHPPVADRAFMCRARAGVPGLNREVARTASW